MKKIHNLKLFGLVAILTVALVFIGVDFIEGQKTTERKGNPNKPKPPGKGEISFQNMPLCILSLAGKIGKLGNNSLCDSVGGVTAFAGRQWSISLEIHKNTSDPSLTLSLDSQLGHIEGSDPNPLTDGGYYNGRDDPTDPCPTPTLLDGGRIFGPQFAVGVGISLDNIKDMEPGEYKEVEAELIFKDDYGDEYHLFWGPGLFPGGIERTNPSAPDVYVVRNSDANGKRNWLVYTQAESARGNAHTAFLWKLSKPWTWDYCGAYNVSFSYTAIEE